MEIRFFKVYIIIKLPGFSVSLKTDRSLLQCLLPRMVVFLSEQYSQPIEEHSLPRMRKISMNTTTYFVFSWGILPNNRTRRINLNSNEPSLLILKSYLLKKISKHISMIIIIEILLQFWIQRIKLLERSSLTCCILGFNSNQHRASSFF